MFSKFLVLSYLFWWKKDSLPSLKQVDNVVSRVKEDASQISVTHENVGTKLDEVKNLRNKLDDLERSIIEEQKILLQEQKAISEEEDNLEKKVNFLRVMKDHNVQSVADLNAKYKNDLETMKTEESKMLGRRSKIDDKAKLIDDLKKSGIDSFDQLESIVKEGAKDIKSKEIDIKNKLNALSSKLDPANVLEPKVEDK